MDNETKSEKSALDFLNEITAKPEIFQEETVSQAEEPVVEEREQPVRFDKDTKVQRYIERQIEKALKDVKPSAEREFREAVSSDVDDVVKAFTTIIGNDTPDKVKALDALKKTLEGSDERAS